MHLAHFCALAPLALVAACSDPLPSQQLAGAYPTEVAGLRANLATACTPEETDILFEGLAILADASRAETLTASQRSAIESRDAAFQSRLPSVSSQCRARLNELAGPNPFRA